MIDLIQFPWSPHCIVQRRILEASAIRFTITNIPNGDRKLVWKVTRGRYYQVPVLRDGKTVLFETDGNSQVIAKYLDGRFDLGLFPAEWEGVQCLLWQYFENEVEGFGFKLNDIYWQEIVPKSDHLNFVRHKERKFGRGCLDQWGHEQGKLLEGLEASLQPCELMLAQRQWLLADRPLFVDFNLFGMLANYLYSGHYQLPGSVPRIKDWYSRMEKLKLKPSPTSSQAKTRA